MRRSPSIAGVRYDRAMLSVVIPTLEAASSLDRTLDALAAEPDLVREVIVADGGSRDGTVALAERRGARVVAASDGRGAQLAAGAAAAGQPWLLFLHADTRLAAGWPRAAEKFAAAPQNARRAAVFRFTLDDDARAARRLETMVAWRCRTLALPYGDQGLLIARRFYEELGGFRPLPLMEDVDLARRIGRRRFVFLDVAAVTSAARFREGGYLRRSARNLFCLGLYYLGVPPGSIVRFYR
jgi:rSAM/selenodomain-associated transferase 2